jgi:hypothetical protein
MNFWRIFLIFHYKINGFYDFGRKKKFGEINFRNVLRVKGFRADEFGSD